MKSFKELMKEDLPIIEQTKPAKAVIDYRKEWYVKDPKTMQRIGRIPKYALVEIKILKQSNDVLELLKETKNGIDIGVVFTALTIEESEEFAGTSMFQEPNLI
jgi:hypothetical protein